MSEPLSKISPELAGVQEGKAALIAPFSLALESILG